MFSGVSVFFSGLAVVLAVGRLNYRHMRAVCRDMVCVYIDSVVERVLKSTGKMRVSG
jgi:hypothetical protein